MQRKYGISLKKRFWQESILKASQTAAVSVRQACCWYGISPQEYYQARLRALQREAEDQIILTLVRALRQRHPRMGGRKLYHELRPAWRSLGFQRTRDAFFAQIKFTVHRTTWISWG